MDNKKVSSSTEKIKLVKLNYQNQNQNHLVPEYEQIQINSLSTTA